VDTLFCPESSFLAQPVSAEAFFGGKLLVRQPSDGYRFSIDALLLADFAAPAACWRVLDLGTGCGIIPLILAHRFPGLRLIGVEVQPRLAQMAACNVVENALADRIRILPVAMQALGLAAIGGPVDLVVSNPPYRKTGSGRINPNCERAVARHEIQVSLPELLQTACRLLRTGGRLAMIYPAQRLMDLLVEMRRAAIEAKRLQMVHSRPGTPAKRVLVEGLAGARPGCRVLPPLVIYGPDGQYTPEVSATFYP
jgi:tRNA1Val (adenine37-N6)-methyltransferase